MRTKLEVGQTTGPGGGSHLPRKIVRDAQREEKPRLYVTARIDPSPGFFPQANATGSAIARREVKYGLREIRAPLTGARRDRDHLERRRSKQSAEKISIAH